MIPLKKGTPGFSYEHRHPAKKRLTLRVDKVIGFHGPLIPKNILFNGGIMKVLIHTMESAESLVKMKKVIETALPKIRGETFPTLESLAERLKEPYNGEEKVALLAATDEKNLGDILSLQRLFLNVPLILLVPNRTPETMALAHRLRPRFLNDVQGDFTAVIEVLRKMVKGKSETAVADSPRNPA